MEKYNPVVSDQEQRDSEYPASMLSFILQNENKKLIGTVFIAQGEEPKPLLLLLPGFPGNEVNFDIAHAVRRAGWNVLVFNYRGSWGSSGDYLFSNSLEDIDDVLAYIKNSEFKERYNTDTGKLVIAGHSFGGFNALKKASEHDEIKHAAAFACFNMGYVGKLFEVVPGAKDMALEKLSMGANMLNNTSGEALYNNILSHTDDWDLLQSVNKLKGKNILLIAAEHDHLAPVDINHKPLSGALKDLEDIKLSVYMLDTGHSFSDKRIELTSCFIEWLDEINF